MSTTNNKKAPFKKEKGAALIQGNFLLIRRHTGKIVAISDNCLEELFEHINGIPVFRLQHLASDILENYAKFLPKDVPEDFRDQIVLLNALKAFFTQMDNGHGEMAETDQDRYENFDEENSANEE